MNGLSVPIGAELHHMSAELESLGGGGDTRITETDVVVRVIAPDSSTTSGSAIRAEGTDVVVRDPTRSAVATERCKRYKATQVLGASGSVESTALEELNDTVGARALEWLWDGFNCSVISHGQGGGRKRDCLFGNGSESSGLCDWLLQKLFQRINTCHSTSRHPMVASSARYSIGLSCWEVLGSNANANAVDLLDSTRGRGVEGLSFCTCAAASLDEARALLRAARRRSVNCFPRTGTTKFVNLLLFSENLCK